ncbi:hypothetical protein GFS31_34580 [Leptolyngbya sp. BL0902]|nr:hypothetical protein GFS31_34580 [Leptolyngbya sp. BL0902]
MQIKTATSVYYFPIARGRCACQIQNRRLAKDSQVRRE